jgi:hypothetical protein
MSNAVMFSARKIAVLRAMQYKLQGRTAAQTLFVQTCSCPCAPVIKSDPIIQNRIYSDCFGL